MIVHNLLVQNMYQLFIFIFVSFILSHITLKFMFYVIIYNYIMSSLTFFLMLLLLNFILLVVNMPQKFPTLVKINLQSSSNLGIFILFLVLSSYLYTSISPHIIKDIAFTSSYIINRISIDLQSNNLDLYQLDCIHKELLFHIDCNYIYLQQLPVAGPLNNYSLEYTYILLNKNLIDLYSLLENVKTLSILLNKIK